MTRAKKRKTARQERAYAEMIQRPDRAKAMRARQSQKGYKGRREFGKLYVKLAGSWADVL